MTEEQGRENNKNICPGFYFSLIFKKLAQDLRDNANLNAKELHLVSYIYNNVLVNLKGNYCRCETCMKIYEDLTSQMKADKLFMNKRGEEFEVPK